MATATRRIEWTSQKGQAVVVTVNVEVDLSPRVIWADGQEVKGGVELTERINYTATLDGVDLGGSSWISPAPKGAPSIVSGVIGRLAFNAENRARIESATSDAVASLETQEIKDFRAGRESAIAENTKAESEYRQMLKNIAAQEGE